MTDALREGFEIGGYRIEATTGNEATGAVHRATQIATGATVALHVVAPRLARDPGFRARFHRELGVLAELSHPHLLQVFETGEDGNGEYEPSRVWAAVAPAPGVDLATLVHEQGRLAPVLAARIVAEAAVALEQAHARGVLHRGLEPASIHVGGLDSDQPSSQLGGFGLVDDGALEGGNGDIRRSAYPPSPDYVAPEQISGKHVDRPADIYALGGVLYFALTGRPPFEGSSIEDVLSGHLRGNVPVPTRVAGGVPETLNGVVARALAKNPAERHATAAELADDILRNAGVRRGGSQLAPPPAPSAVPPPESEGDPAEPIDPASAADKQRVIRAWTDAVSSGGRLWSPSVAGSVVAAAASAAAPAPDEVSHGDFSQFEQARRRRAEQEGDPGHAGPVEEEAEAKAPAPTVAPPMRTPRPVEAPPPKGPPTMPASRTRNVAMGIGAAVVIAALAIGGIVVAGNGDDDPNNGAAPSKPSEKPVKPAREETPAPKKKPAPKSKPAGVKLVSWPNREGYTAVVFASPSDRSGALARARKAAATGAKAGVLRSDKYGSLQPGIWVAFAGVYDTEAQAQAEADRLKRRGVAAQPYTRRVGAQP